MAMSDERKRFIKGSLYKYEKFDLSSLNIQNNLQGVYDKSHNIIIIEIEDKDSSYFIQDTGKNILKNFITNDLNFQHNSTDPDIFYIDYSEEILPGYEVINIDTTVEDFIHRDNKKHYKTFEEFRDDLLK